MSIRNSYASAWESVPVTIENGTALTNTIDLGGLRLFGVVLPSVWTTADLSFQMSPDNGSTWCNLLDQTGNEITVSSNLSSCMMVDPKLFAPLQFIRIRSGLSSSAVNQTAARVLQLILRIV